MLGRMIRDPYGVEGEEGMSHGLNFLPIETELTKRKQLTEVQAILRLNQKSTPVTGYEIHVGRTSSDEKDAAIFDANGLKPVDGAVSECNQVFGTYLHGVFDSPKALELICEWSGADYIKAIDRDQQQENAIDRIADAVEKHIDLTQIWPELYQ